MARTKKIYLASSWRNLYQPKYVEMLRDWGYQVYDFRNPNDGSNYSWEQIDPDWQGWTTEKYLEALEHPLAVAGFDSDFGGMEWADTGILLMPCGNSASQEIGHMNGAGKKTIAFFPEAHTNPDLMVKMFDYRLNNFTRLYKALRADHNAPHEST